MTCCGGSTFCSCTCGTRTPALYWSSVFCISSCTRSRCLPRAGQDGWMSVRPITSRMALSATAFTVPSGFWMLNRYLPAPARLDLPEHREIDVDDVLVAGEHQALFRHVAQGGAAAQIVDDAHADVDLATACLRREHGLDRIRQVVVQAGLHLAEFAEAQHHADLVRLDPEEAGKAPEHHSAEHEQGEAPAAEIAARQHVLELVLAAAQKFFEVRRGRTRRLRPEPQGPFDPPDPQGPPP